MTYKPRATLILEAPCEALADIGTPTAASEPPPLHGILEKEIWPRQMSHRVGEPTNMRVGRARAPL